MSKYDAMHELNELMVSIKNHSREWFGMIGTSFEQDDWKEKQNKKRKLEKILFA